MTWPIVLRPEASLDVEEARDYFERKRADLGQEFLDQLKDVLDRISAMPQIYGSVWRNLRAARLRRFTYVVYYRVHDDRVEVLAALHGRRDASAWRSRT
ncbi:MAG TPA: type II toxin-antitoxin system RelE/ParE family toxin [Gemmataceae bacterium]|nr:type II toxin-antitoxin system RelE/ParE family toxin [Gemmataceae bacterium]